MFVGVRINIIYMMPQAADPRVFNDIPEISVLKARNKPRLVQGKIHLPVENNLCTGKMSLIIENELKTEIGVNIHVRV